MKSMPSSTARRRPARAPSRSGGSPQIPSPVMRIAPYPRRCTVRSPPRSSIPALTALVDDISATIGSFASLGPSFGTWPSAPQRPRPGPPWRPRPPGVFAGSRHLAPLPPGLFGFPLAALDATACRDAVIAYADGGARHRGRTVTGKLLAALALARAVGGGDDDQGSGTRPRRRRGVLGLEAEEVRCDRRATSPAEQSFPRSARQRRGVPSRVGASDRPVAAWGPGAAKVPPGGGPAAFRTARR